MNGINQDLPISNLASLSYLPENILDINKLIRQLRQQVKLILGVSVCTFLLAFLYILTLTPKYQSSTLIQIRSQSNNANMFSKIGYKQANSESVADTAVALMRSRYVLEPVILQN